MPLPTDTHNSTPTLPLNPAQQARFTELAQQLEQARIQGYVEANVLVRLLDLLKELLPLALKL